MPLLLLRSAMVLRLWLALVALLASFFRRSCVVSRLCPWPRGLPATAAELSCRYLSENPPEPISRKTVWWEEPTAWVGHPCPSFGWEETRSPKAGAQLGSSLQEWRRGSGDGSPVCLGCAGPRAPGKTRTALPGGLQRPGCSQDPCRQSPALGRLGRFGPLPAHNLRWLPLAL